MASRAGHAVARAPVQELELLICAPSTKNGFPSTVNAKWLPSCFRLGMGCATTGAVRPSKRKHKIPRAKKARLTQNSPEWPEQVKDSPSALADEERPAS